MATVHEATFRVDTRELDPFGQCRPSALLGLLQEAATTAAVELRVDRDALIEKYGLFWMVARTWYRLDRPLRWNEEVTVQTWHRGGRGASSYRDFDLLVGDETVGEAVSLWVLADLETHKLARMSCVTEFEGTDGGMRNKDKMLPKLRLPDDLQQRERRRLHYSDADINGHVNNARYADFFCDAVRLEQLGAGHFVSQMQIGYLAEAKPGEELVLSVGAQDANYFVRGVGQAGAPCFEGLMELSPIQK